MTLIEVLAVWGITLNERQAQQLLEEMMGADDFVVQWRVKGEYRPEVINRVKQKLGYPKQWLEVTDDE